MKNNKEKYLSDVVEIEKPEFGSNNLILSPVGSGKTTFIKRILAKYIEGVIILLVSNTNLKDNVSPQDNELRKKKGERTYTTKNRKIYGEGKVRIYVMTYHEFGYRITNNDDSIKNITQIHCDEFHSLVEYKSYGDNEGLIHAMRYLLNPQEGKQIFYYTATSQTLLDLKKRNPEAFKYVKIFNYLEYTNIKKYINLFEEEFSHVNQIKAKIKDLSKDFKRYGYKGLVYSRTIASMKEIEDILIEEGFNPLVLWSINNIDYEMTPEQAKARDEIISTNKIPDGYDFLIINNAMREGWDLFDEKVELVIINSVSETDIIQARGRARKNIAKLIYRTESNEPTDKEILDKVLSYKILNIELTDKRKETLVDKVNLYRSNGEQVKWRKIKEVLESNGYEITDKKVQKNKKRQTISIITKKQ